jgi:flagellin
LDSIISNLTSASSNTAAARSRIVDVDYSQETTKLSKALIIRQAATAILAQANQAPQTVLALLKT